MRAHRHGHRHGHAHCGPHHRFRHHRHRHRRSRGLLGYLRDRLHRRLFVWFAMTIVVSLAAGAAMLAVTAGNGGYAESSSRARRAVGGVVAELWDEPERRDRVLRRVAADLDVDLILADAAGDELLVVGERCDDPWVRVPVERGGRPLGEARVCGRPEHRGPFPWLAGLLVAAAVLWAAAGFLSRRLVRPLAHVVRVARDIGDGKLDTRMELGRHSGEIGMLSDAINDMAARIEKQLTDQKELLATVSHEIRTPLGHLRVLTELARDKGLDPATAEELEREIRDLDELTEQLLATSRLEFDRVEPKVLRAAEIGRRALSRVGADEALLDLADEGLTFEADPTLLGSALSNLLSNADKHGGGATALRIAGEEDAVVFEVLDEGPGFGDVDRDRLFESFYRGERKAAGSLGLGLSLVRRVAEAHGGSCWAEDRDGGGARVGFRVAMDLVGDVAGPNGAAPETDVTR